MQRLAARAGPVRLALLIAALALAAVPAPLAQANAQPDPAAKIHVESTEVNLTASPAFTFAVQLPTVLRFVAFDHGGVRYLHIWAISRVDSLDARIRKATNYLTERPGIFTPLFDPSNRGANARLTDREANSLGLLRFWFNPEVDRSGFERALRDLRPARTMSYNRRLT